MKNRATLHMHTGVEDFESMNKAPAKLGRSWRNLALVSLTLTARSGLMAVSFWTLRAEFDPAGWLPNLFLLLYPLGFCRR